MEASPASLFKAIAAKRRTHNAAERDKQHLFKTIAQKRKGRTGNGASDQSGGKSDDSRNRPSTGLQVLFKKLASRTESSDSASSSTRATLTAGFVHEVAARQKLSADKEQEAKVSRRYRNCRREAQKLSRVKMTKSVSATRADSERVKVLMTRECRCCMQVCWSQFQAIMADLLALLMVFTEQTKKVRDEVLRLCVGSTGVCVLGFQLSVACFSLLFQVGNNPMQMFRSGALHIDRRMKGKPRKPAPKVQDTRIRMYLSTTYCRSLFCFRANLFFHDVWMVACHGFIKA